MSAYSTCKCGKQMLWARTPSGGKIPLDAVAPVYRVSLDESSNIHASEPQNKNLNIGDAFMVSHFATCKYANDFSHGKQADKITVDEAVQPLDGKDLASGGEG